MWLFHLHRTVNNTAFFSGFPLGGIAEPLAKAFCRLFLWNFKEKSINRFLGHSHTKQSHAMTGPRKRDASEQGVGIAAIAIQLRVAEPRLFLKLHHGVARIVQRVIAAEQDAILRMPAENGLEELRLDERGAA